jgi:hypothetical protein
MIGGGGGGGGTRLHFTLTLTGGEGEGPFSIRQLEKLAVRTFYTSFTLFCCERIHANKKDPWVRVFGKMFVYFMSGRGPQAKEKEGYFRRVSQ